MKTIPKSNRSRSTYINTFDLKVSSDVYHSWCISGYKRRMWKLLPTEPKESLSVMLLPWMNWITFIAPYCENYTSRSLYKDSTTDISNKYLLPAVWTNEALQIVHCFHGDCCKQLVPEHIKGRPPNLVQDDRLVTASLTPDVDTDRRIDRLSLMNSGKQRSAM